MRSWLDARGMQFRTGADPDTELTDAQILEQCKMYIAAMRIADEFGCDAIGIQYQQGLKDLTPASDLAEGLFNNVDRPPVRDAARPRALREPGAAPLQRSGRVRRTGCAGDQSDLDAAWLRPGNHVARYSLRRNLRERRRGVRLGVRDLGRGAAESPHRWICRRGQRAPAPHVFPARRRYGQGSGKPGEIVWSRIFVDNGALKADLGRAKVVELPHEETERRWRITTPQWPIMHAVTYGVTRDQMMARHKSNHIQVAYAPDAERANLALAAKAATFREMGMDVSICGTENGLL